MQLPSFGGEYINDVDEEYVAAEGFGKFPLGPACFVPDESILVQLAESPSHLYGDRRMSGVD